MNPLPQSVELAGINCDEPLFLNPWQQQQHFRSLSSSSSGTGAGKRQGSSDQRLQQPPLASFVPFSIAVLYRSEPLVADVSIGTSGEFQQLRIE